MRQLTLLVLLAMTTIAWAADEDELRTLLDEFLAGASVGDVAAHEKFWDDNLVYTSSSGARTDKAAIVEGMRRAAAAASEADDAAGPSVIYSANDVEIDLYGDTAIVAFKLVGTPQGDSEEATAYYFNTGTFIKTAAGWKVVAWQATRIPPVVD